MLTLEGHLLHAFDPGPGESRAQALHRAADEMTYLTTEAGLGGGSAWCVIITRQAPRAAIRERVAHAGMVVLGSRSGSVSSFFPRGLTRELIDGFACPILLLPSGQHPDGMLAGRPDNASVPGCPRGRAETTQTTDTIAQSGERPEHEA